MGPSHKHDDGHSGPSHLRMMANKGWVHLERDDGLIESGVLIRPASTSVNRMNEPNWIAGVFQVWSRMDPYSSYDMVTSITPRLGRFSLIHRISRTNRCEQ